MIGQVKNRKQILEWKLNKSLPRFILIIGQKGSGRLTLAKKISESISCTPVIVDNKIDEIREVINSSYTVSDTTMYIFRNVDTMSVGAKNSLLKITEEPPNNAYFIMTLEQESNMLETILSRSTQIKMEEYDKELDHFIPLDWQPNNYEIVKLFKTPGTVQEWVNKGESELVKFFEFVDNIANNISNMYGTDILQVSNKLKCKDSQEGYDCTEFVKALYYRLPTNNIDIAKLTNKCIYDLGKSGLKKTSTVDLYLLELKNLLTSY